MSVFEKIYKWFQDFWNSSPNPVPLPTPDPITQRVKVDSNYVFNILNNVRPKATHIFESDSVYWLCSEKDIEKFLQTDDTKNELYIAEEHDCDDFAYRLMGNLSTPEWSGIAFGIVWTNTHALNCLIDSDGKFWYIEPQSGTIQDKLEDWQGNEILFIMM